MFLFFDLSLISRNLCVINAFISLPDFVSGFRSLNVEDGAGLGFRRLTYTP